MGLLATPVQFYFGFRFYKGAYLSLKHGGANMDVLVALGTSAAYFYGLIMTILYAFSVLDPTPEEYVETAHSFEISATLICIILLGKYLESTTKHKTTDAISKLIGL
mmetsp:Transcript_29316/g.5295  ORF Transcript_29316/g.5295 Transcript_29316/m.5295 type:complete len:107 (+) Transcript_29316:690-1010(+)